MPVDLSIVESTTELGQTVVEVILESASEPGPAGPGVPVGGTDGQVLTKTSATDYATAWEDPTGGGGSGAPDDATYLVTTAHGDLSAEVVVGATPGGELGGTWASPTVDASHSGSTHAAVQAAAEATAAAALSSHEGDTTAVHGIADTSALALTANHPSNATFNDHSARHEDGGADEISLTGLSGTPAALTTHEADTTSVHGIADTSALALTANHPSNATFNDHSARHENGGADEISVVGLSGLLADAQTPLSHNHAGEDITSGTVADARIASTIARDSEVVLQTLADAKGDIVAASAADTWVRVAVGTNGQVLTADSSASGGVAWDDASGGGSGDALTLDVNQSGHGLAVQDVVKLSGSGTYAKAQANSEANAEVVGIVSAVADTDNFTLTMYGLVTGFSGLTAATVYYLDDDTAGLLTTTEPTDAGDISKPVLIARTTTSGFFVNYRGMVQS